MRIPLLCLMASIFRAQAANCTEDQCGLYGDCESNGCKCAPLYRGDNCSMFESKYLYPDVYKAFSSSFLAIYALITVLIVTQVMWKFRVKSWKRNIPSCCIILITLWSFLRVIYYGVQDHRCTKTSQASGAAALLWLRLFAADLCLSTVFLLLKAWMGVIREIVFKFAYQGEKIFISRVDFIIIAFQCILYGIEISAVVTVAKHTNEAVVIRSYWFVVGIQTLILSAFFAVYGKRILFLLRHSNSKTLEERANHVSRIITIMGMCAFCTISMICTAELAKFDEHAETWYVFEGVTCLIEIACMGTIFSLVKDETYLRPYSIKFWLCPSLVTVPSMRLNNNSFATASGYSMDKSCSKMEDNAESSLVLPGALKNRESLLASTGSTSSLLHV